MFKYFFLLFLWTTIACNSTQRLEPKGISNTITTKDFRFESEGVELAGTIYTPHKADAAVVIVHGSDQVPRMDQFARRLADQSIMVLSYDKRGVAQSGGVYAGPEVGTNNISQANLNLLAQDAKAALDQLHLENKNIPLGLLGFSQAGWIIPIAAKHNPKVDFMVLFSCPTITTLEQLRFQFYTDGRKDFWDQHTEKDARYHIENDPDRYQFEATDPKASLNDISIPGLWLFGERDIQVPVKIGIEHLNSYKAHGKPFDYVLFPDLGHSTASIKDPQPFDIAVKWIKKFVANSR